MSATSPCGSGFGRKRIHLLEHSRFEPPLGLLIDGFPRRQVVWHVSPRRSGANHPPQSVEHLAKVVVALGSVLSEERQIRSYKGPLFVGNVARIWFSCSHTKMLTLPNKVHNTL